MPTSILIPALVHIALGETPPPPPMSFESTSISFRLGPLIASRPMNDGPPAVVPVLHLPPEIRLFWIVDHASRVTTPRDCPVPQPPTIVLRSTSAPVRSRMR